MITGIGTDLVKIGRIKKSLETTGDRFAKRILEQSEFMEFSKSVLPANFLAKRFAVKEAAGKALGTGIGQGVSWQDIIVEHDEIGAPILKFKGRAAELAEQKGVKSMHVSISDEVEYATAFVILSTT